MKHIEFEFAEPLMVIQRVPNKVFLDGNDLSVLNYSTATTLVTYFKKNGIDAEIESTNHGGYFNIWLPRYDEYFVGNEEEIYIFKGTDEIWEVDSFGVKHCITDELDNTL